jgi:hypothetical protein
METRVLALSADDFNGVARAIALPALASTTSQATNALIHHFPNFKMSSQVMLVLISGLRTNSRARKNKPANATCF